MNSAAMWVVPILVALLGAPLVWLLNRLDRRNTAQHAQSVDILNRLDGKVDDIHGHLGRLNEKLDAHTNDTRRHR